MADANGNDAGSTGGWMSDVQRWIAIALIGTFAFAIIITTIRLVIWGDPPTTLDVVKTLHAAMINMAMVVLGYFFGSSKSKEGADASQQRIVEKLTATAPPGPPGPVAPVPSPVVVISWWSLLTDAERAAISAAAPTDSKSAAFMAAAQTGKATADDLAAMVAKGFITQDRAVVVSAA